MLSCRSNTSSHYIEGSYGVRRSGKIGSMCYRDKYNTEYDILLHFPMLEQKVILLGVHIFIYICITRQMAKEPIGLTL